VDGLTDRKIECPKDFMDMLADGDENKKVASTGINIYLFYFNFFYFLKV
jgi:hypothetical protein